MPKRKSEKSLDYIVKKLKWLEEEIKKRPSRSRYRRSSSSSSSRSSISSVSSSSTSSEQDVMDDNVNLPEPMSIDSLAIPSTSKQRVESQSNIELNPVVLEVLGIDPSTITNYGPAINTELANRLVHVLTSGLKKEERVEMSKKYLIPENCQFIAAPELNAEMKIMFSELSKKRDKAIEMRQKSVATVISCLSHVISSQISSCESPDQELLQKLVDATRLLCDVNFTDSITRRNFALSTVKKELQEQLANTKITKYLFGENLGETLKAAKEVSKLGTDLKYQASSFEHSKNWKSTPGKRKHFSGPASSARQRSATSARPNSRNVHVKTSQMQGKSWNVSHYRQRTTRKR